MIKVSALRQYRFTDGVSLFIDNICEDARYTVRKLEFEKVENLYEADIEAPISLLPQATQKLMDDLWDAGFRPSEGTGSAGCLAATQKHLTDMRKIVSNKLKVEL